MTYALIAFMCLIAIVMFIAGYASGYQAATDLWRFRLLRLRGYMGVGGMREW